MSIASNLQAIATSLSGVLSAINTKLTAKGSTAADTLSEVPDKINAIQTGTTPAGTKSITENGTYDVTTYASAVVAVPEPSGTKTITTNGTHDVSEYASATVNVPTENPPSGTVNITANGTVDVANYASANVNVPTGTARTDSDLTASGKTVTVPAGLYSQQYTKDVSTAQQATPSVSLNTSTGLVTATASQSAGYVSSGTKSVTYQLTTQSAQTITPGTSDQTIASGKYLTGTQTIKGDADLIPGNIKAGVNIFGVSGNYSGGGYAEIGDQLTITNRGSGTYHSLTVSLSGVDMTKLLGVVICHTSDISYSDYSDPVILCAVGLYGGISRGETIVTAYGKAPYAVNGLSTFGSTTYVLEVPSSLYNIDQMSKYEAYAIYSV